MALTTWHEITHQGTRRATAAALLERITQHLACDRDATRP